MFFPPSFEPHSIIEPQWFPRPINDNIESSLDLLERAEEERKTRLRNIAHVSSRVPIGLGVPGGSGSGSGGVGGGVSGGGPAGGTSNFSGGTPESSGSGSNAYSRYRYYPPPSPNSTSLHERMEAMETPPYMAPPTLSSAVSSTRRMRHNRRVVVPKRPEASSTPSGNHRSTPRATPRSAASSAVSSVDRSASYSRSGNNVAFMNDATMATMATAAMGTPTRRTPHSAAGVHGAVRYGVDSDADTPEMDNTADVAMDSSDAVNTSGLSHESGAAPGEMTPSFPHISHTAISHISPNGTTTSFQRFDTGESPFPASSSLFGGTSSFFQSPPASGWNQEWNSSFSQYASAPQQHDHQPTQHSHQHHHHHAGYYQHHQPNFDSLTPIASTPRETSSPPPSEGLHPDTPQDPSSMETPSSNYRGQGSRITSRQTPAQQRRNRRRGWEEANR